MTLNTFKCNCPTPLHLKGLSDVVMNVIVNNDDNVHRQMMF